MIIKKAETKRERLFAMAAKMLGMGTICVNGKGERIVMKSDYERLQEKEKKRG